MKIKSVEIWGMHNVLHKKYDFSNVNYFFGKNGSGKTTVLQAVQLALLGYIPGTNKKAQDIFTHSCAPEMKVSLVFDNGYNVTRSYKKNKQSVKSETTCVPDGFDPSDILRDIELPVFNFSSFLAMSPNAMKDWFIKFLPSSENEVNWKEILDGSEVSYVNDSLYQDVLNYASGLTPDIEGVIKLNEYMKSLLSFKQAEQKRYQSTFSSLVYYQDYDGPNNENEITDKIASLRLTKQKYLNDVSAYNSQKYTERCLSEYSDLKDEINDDDDFTSCQSSVRDLENKLKEIDSKKFEIEREINSRRHEYDEVNKVASTGGICSYTNEVCSSIQPMINGMKERAVRLKESISNLRTQLESISYSRMSVCKTLNETNQKLSAIIKRYGERDTILKSYKPVSKPEDLDISFIDNEIARLEECIVQLRANLQYDRISENVSREKMVMEQDIDTLKNWINATGPNGIQANLSEKPFHDMEIILNNFLHNMYDPDISFKFILDSKNNSFGFGIVRDKRFIKFDTLSSGEKCIVSIILATGLIRCNDSKIHLMLVDDALDHLDDEKADMFFRTLAKIEDTQFILAGVKKCSVNNSDNFKITEII
jgi:DNA repair exonuclease SbcCD ATPase subunit